MIEAIAVFAAQSLAQYALNKKLDSFFNPKEDAHIDALKEVIIEALNRYEKEHPERDSNGKFAFYKSEIITTELLKHRIFGKENALNTESLQKAFSENPNIKPLTTQQLEQFINYFHDACKANTQLAALEKQYRFPEKIYEIAAYLEKLLALASDQKNTGAEIKEILELFIKNQEAQSPDKAFELFVNRQILPWEAVEGNINIFNYRSQKFAYVPRPEENTLEGFLNSNAHFSWWAITGEGGSGKSRLAFEFTKSINQRKKWTALFLQWDKKLLHFDTYEYSYPLLLIIDYIPAVAEDLGAWLLKLATTRRVHSIRVLLLEREGREKEENTVKPTNENTHQALPSEAIRYKDPYWMQQLQKGAGYNSRLMQHLHSPGLLPLKPMDEAGLSAIITNYLKGINKSLPDQNTIQKIIATLKSIDPEGGRPLYLLFLADAWALNGKKILNWDRNKLLNWIHQNELKRIRLICSDNERVDTKTFQAAYYLMAVATGIEQLPLVVARNRHKPVKKALGVLEKFAAKTGVSLSQWIPALGTYDHREATLKGLQPDLMGEYFVLELLKEYDDPLAPEQLSKFIALCWTYPERFVLFLYKCLRDYPEESILRKIVFYTSDQKVIQKWQSLLWATAIILDVEEPEIFLAKLQGLAESSTATPEIVLHYAMGLVNYTNKQPVEAIPETLSKLQGLSESPSATPEIVLQYAMGLYNYSFEQPLEAIPETLSKLQRLSESPSATPEIVLHYAMGLVNYTNRQPVEAIPETLSKLQGLSESPSATPEIVLQYAMGLYNYSFEQPLEAIPETLGKLQGLSESSTATPEIVLAYAMGLYNYSNKQPLEAIPETLGKLQGLSEAPSATPEIVLQYAQGLVNYTNKQPLEAIPETLGKLQGLSEAPSATPEIVLQYAQGLVNYTNKQPLEAIPETLGKLQGLSEAPSATPEIVLQYAIGLYNYSNKQAVEVIPETLGKLQGLSESSTATPEIVLAYAMGLYNYSNKQPVEAIPETLGKLQGLSEAPSATPEIVLQYAQGLVNYTNKQPLEAIPETLGKLQGLSEAPSAIPEIVLRYAMGLYNYSNKQPVEVIPETLGKLQGLAESSTATPEIVLQYAQGLVNYTNKQPVEAIPETLGKLQGLSEAPSATPEIVLRYAMGLANFTHRNPYYSIEGIQKLKLLALSNPENEEILVIMYLTLILKWLDNIIFIDKEEFQFILNVLSNFVKQNSDHKFDNLILQLFQTLKEIGIL
jgi:hypothetical protein